MMIHRTLMVLSGLVVLSYLFDLVSKRTRVPTVLLLMAVGFLLQFVTAFYQIEVPPVTRGLFLLGTAGLILIVFEGAMDIHYTWRKLALIRKSFFSGLFNFIGTTSAVTFVFHYYFDAGYYDSLLNAIPLAVISSAIAIPSVEHLDASRKEFIVMESAISDIIGIMAFYFLIDNREITPLSLTLFGLNSVATVAISLLFCMMMFYILARNKHKIKFFLVIALLIFVYGYAKKYLHMPALLIVFVFGLALRNANQITWGFFKKKLLYDHFQQDFTDIQKMNAEFAFVVRTFFFIIFGYTISPESLSDPGPVKFGLLILMFIFTIRIFYNLATTRKLPIPESLVNPRGLISILLFMNIPDANKIPVIGESLLLTVIIGSCLIMSAGMILSNLGRKH